MSEHDPTSPGRFLTLAETAQILNVPEPSILALVESSELPAIRVGTDGPWRVERTVLESFIEALYEESRRHSLWHGSDFANIPELSGGEILRSDD